MDFDASLDEEYGPTELDQMIQGRKNQAKNKEQKEHRKGKENNKEVR